MRRSVIALGDRKLAGQYGRVMAAGDLAIENSDVRSILAAGDIAIRQSKIGKLRCAGDISAHQTVFNRCKAAGDMKLTGICKADLMSVYGSLSAQMLESRILVNNKVQGNDRSICRWTGCIKAETLENRYQLAVEFDSEVRHYISCGLLKWKGELQCESFYSFGDLSADILNAESVFVLVQEQVRVNGIEGGHIVVSRQFTPDKRFRSIPQENAYGAIQGSGAVAEVASIEGDRIEVENVKAESISGMDVTVGDLCIIERVEYSNSIQVSEKAIVNEVVRR